MAKKRGGKPQEYQKRLFILCEGSKNHSEEAYLKGFLKICKVPSTVTIEVKDSKKNTGKELVEAAADLKEFPYDEVWVVYDKDGYTKHPETFQIARQKNVNIAFSAISFEVWILLHFKYTTTSFLKSEKVINYIKKNTSLAYKKNNKAIYQHIIKANGSLETALANAEKIQKFNLKSHHFRKRYKYDAYTDVDKLIIAIRKMIVKK